MNKKVVNIIVITEMQIKTKLIYYISTRIIDSQKVILLDLTIDLKNNELFYYLDLKNRV